MGPVVCWWCSDGDGDGDGESNNSENNMSNTKQQVDVKDSVAFLNFLRNEAESTMDIMKERTPFDSVYSGIQNAYDTLGHHESISMPPEWCQLALDSIRGLCCDSEPEDVCQWFKDRGMRY